MRAYVAIAVCVIAIVLMQLPAYANLNPGSVALPGIEDGSTPHDLGNYVPTLTPEQAALAPTQAQKDEALKIAATSPLCKQYNAYPDASWSVGWTGVPADDHTILVSKEVSPNYFLDIIVDLNTGSIVKAEYNQGFGEYASPFSTDASLSPVSSIFSSMPSIGIGNSGFNTLGANTQTDNSELQAPSTLFGYGKTSGLSQPLSIFSKSLNTFPSFGSGAQLFSM